MGGLIGVVKLRGVRVGWKVGRCRVAGMREVVWIAEVVFAAIASTERVVEPFGVVAECFAEGVMLK